MERQETVVPEETCGTCVREVFGEDLGLAGAGGTAVSRTADARPGPGHHGRVQGSRSRDLHRGSA